MVVCVFRAQDYDKREIDTELINMRPGRVRWVKDRGLNNHSIPLSNYILCCYIDYSAAVELGLASGLHSDVATEAKIFLYKKDNENAKCKEGYKFLCHLAGDKPKR